MSAEEPLSVVMISASFHPYIGGAEKQALELSAALRGRGVKTTVVTRRLPGLSAREEVRGVPVIRLWCLATGLLNSASFLCSLSYWLWRQADTYQAIHVHLAGSPALAAAAAGRLLGKRVWVKLGGGRGIGELSASSSSCGGRLKLWVFSKIKPRFLSVTADLAEEARDILGPVSVAVIPNGVDTDRYGPVSAEEKKRLRRRFGWPGGPLFLYVGRFSPEKRLPWFLEAWAELPGQAAAVFIGEGQEAALLKETASRVRASERVFVLPGMEDVAAAYAAADAFVLPSISEGLSNALLEAMASGLPIVGSRVGGTAEAVREGETGLLFEALDREGLKRQLSRALESPGELARMGRNARAAALERYSLERAAARYEALYRGDGLD